MASFSAIGLLVGVVLSLLVCLTRSLEYTEVFRDDFNDDAVDLEKWNIITVPSLVNEELEHYVSDEVWEEHGFLFLRSQRRQYADRNFTSGRVDTQNKFKFLYGEVEWRAKLPAGQGIWPALWLLHWQCPPASPCVTWPPEIDVMEARGDAVHKITTTVHHGRFPNNGYDGIDVFGPDYTADFHTFKAIWDPNQIVWFVDGAEVYKITDWNKIPHEEMYLIMNVAVGGWYSGNPDWSTPFPTHMLIDYVTVHKWQ
jgi:beta-glucanase (GH16 family)